MICALAVEVFTCLGVRKASILRRPQQTPNFAGFVALAELSSGSGSSAASIVSLDLSDTDD